MRLFSKLSCILLATFLLILPFFGCDTTIDTNDPTDNPGGSPTPTPDAVEPTETPNTPEAPTELKFGDESYPLDVTDIYIEYMYNDDLPQLEYATNLMALKLQLDAAKVDILHQLQPPSTLQQLDIEIVSLAGDTDIELDMSKFSACKELANMNITVTEKVYVSRLTLPDTGSVYYPHVTVSVKEGGGIDLTGCPMLSSLKTSPNTTVTLGLGAENIYMWAGTDLSTLESSSNIERFDISSDKPEIGQALDLSLLPASVKELHLYGEGYDLSKLVDSSVVRLVMRCPDITDLSALIGNKSLERLTIYDYDSNLSDISALESIPSLRTLQMRVYLKDPSAVPDEFLALLSPEVSYNSENADMLGDVDYLNIPIEQLKAFAKGNWRKLIIYILPDS